MAITCSSSFLTHEFRCNGIVSERVRHNLQEQEVKVSRVDEAMRHNCSHNHLHEVVDGVEYRLVAAQEVDPLAK